MNNNEDLGYPNSRLSEHFDLVPPCSDNRGWTVIFFVCVFMNIYLAREITKKLVLPTF